MNHNTRVRRRRASRRLVTASLVRTRVKTVDSWRPNVDSVRDHRQKRFRAFHCHLELRRRQTRGRAFLTRGVGATRFRTPENRGRNVGHLGNVDNHPCFIAFECVKQDSHLGNVAKCWPSCRVPSLSLGSSSSKFGRTMTCFHCMVEYAKLAARSYFRASFRASSSDENRCNIRRLLRGNDRRANRTTSAQYNDK